MRRLQTYIALLTTLLALLAAGIICGVCHFMYHMPLYVCVFATAGTAVGAMLLSLVVSKFLMDPLSSVIHQGRVLAGLEPSGDGQTVDAEAPIQTDGQLLEAEQLAECLNELEKKAAVQRQSLALKESRQNSFISDVAHELRTPVTAIHGTAEMLMDPDLPDSMRERFTTTIVRESDRLSRLTNDLLTLQRLETGKAAAPEFTRVNLRSVAQEVVSMLEPVLTERQANVEISGEAPDVLGNRDQLKQVVSNLVDNASRFIDPDGHIWIELLGLHGNAVITVKDDGTGFGNVDPKLLFDRFYRVDSSRNRATGGTGLGLSIVKTIVTEHDGTVEALNLPEGGACFIVAIPAIAAMD